MPGIAAAQTPAGRLSLQVAAGPTLKDRGYVLSAGAGFSPLSRLDLIVNVERIHVPTRTQHFSGGSSGVTRGGTMTFVSGEARVSLFPPDRVSPFVMAGMGAGVSHPNVNAQFPNPAPDNLRVVYAGGGMRIPLRSSFSLFADARVLLGVEDDEGLMGVWPVRAGLIWRF